MAKTNGCLVTGVCAAAFCGWHVCEHVCAWNVLWRSMRPSFRENYSFFIERAPDVVVKKLSEQTKGVFFG